ncbi:hypothetical protein [Phaeovulum sp. W22_SRMD_FR3]|uniref:hypothetical protein n=1 Tax=Phaeovulum sp. W22_SRMD_FR3 TaxID=3240274 RepID=UPI003F94378A
MHIARPLCVLSLCLMASPGAALDVKQYKAVVVDTIIAIQSGKIDVDALIAQQETLVQLGVQGARDYAKEHPESAPLLTFVADEAPHMSDLTLPQIEAQWHEGAALQRVGLNIHDFDHFSPELSHMDTMVHPATAVIALRDYKATGNEDDLDQVVDELSEVVEHIKHLN